jgi:uncharacterized membrane protein
MENDNGQNTIKAIQVELQQLQEQVVQQYNRIQELQRQLQQIDPTCQIPVTVNAGRSTSRWKWENFIGLRLIHLVGIIVLVIGLSIGVKYAIDQELISPFARIGLAYAAGAILYILSLRLKKNYLLFSSILFSGAMASLYFTTYAASVYYQMLPGMLAFLLMVAFTVFTAIKANAYDRQEIAMLGLVGAYGIPFLISQNADRAELFFLYILIIDSGVLFLTYKKTWRTVGQIAFVLTWALFLGWCTMRFTVAQTWVGVASGIIFFLLFSVMSLLRKWGRKEQLNKADAYMQLANNLAFYIGGILVLAYTIEDQPLATVTGCFGLFIGLQAWSYHLLMPDEDLLHRGHVVVALGLIILFVAMEWDGVSVTFIWLLMAVTIFMWGVWRKMVVLRLGAMGLMGLTLLKLIVLDSARFSTIQKVMAYLSLGVLLLVISFFYQKFKQKLLEE